MADLDITSTNLNTMKALLTFLSTSFVAVGRNLGSPLKHFMNVSSEVANLGQAVNIMIGAPVTSQLLTDGQDIVLDNTVGTGATVTLNKYRMTPFGTTQLADALSGNAAAIVLLQQNIASLLNDIEADCLSVITSGLTNTVGTYNTDISLASLNSAVYTLDNNKAPQGRVGLLRHDAHAWGAFTQLPQIVYSYQTGVASPVNNGNFAGPIYYAGCEYWKTQALPKSVNNIDNCVIAPGALAMACRALPMPAAGIGAMQQNVVDAESGIAMSLTAQWNGKTQATEIIAKCVYGYTVPQVNYGVLLKS